MLEFKKIVTLKEIACVATVFCYVFSFYIIGLSYPDIGRHIYKLINVLLL